MEHGHAVVAEDVEDAEEILRVTERALVAQVIYRRADPLEIVHQEGPVPIDDHEDVGDSTTEELFREPQPLE
jgi:hypothetical protein